MSDPQPPSPEVTVSISRMSNPENIRLRLEIDRELIDVEMTPADFALALTGRANTPARLVRRITRSNTLH